MMIWVKEALKMHIVLYTCLHHISKMFLYNENSLYELQSVRDWHTIFRKCSYTMKTVYMNYRALEIDSILIVFFFILKDTFDFKIKILGTYTTCQCIRRHDDKMSSNNYMFDCIALHKLKVCKFSNSLLQWFL